MYLLHSESTASHQQRSETALLLMQIPDLCPILGLTAPTYRITALSPAAPNIVTGAAYFTSESLFPKPLGEVRNVYGKKNAKEECAKGVWAALSELAKRRGLSIAEVDDDDEMTV